MLKSLGLMKIAISGKGGVGKTLLAAFLAKEFAACGYSVLAIDADSNATLAAALEIPDPSLITPISEMSTLIEERTGIKPGRMGGLYNLNPRVDDIPEKNGVIDVAKTDNLFKIDEKKFKKYTVSKVIVS